MTKEITRGMILAAGLGTRLRPVTNDIPKPMIEVGGRKIIEYNLELLSKSWIDKVVINLHHLGGQIEKYIGDGSRYGLKVKYSREDKIMGTAGGIKKAESFFGEDPFVVINGDMITDVNLTAVMAHHLESGCQATMVLRAMDKDGTYTPILEEGGQVTEFGNGEMMYTGVQVLDSSVLKLIPDGTFANVVADAYIPLLKQGGKINAYIHDGFWMEIGTPDCLKKAKDTFKGGKMDFWYLD